MPLTGRTDLASAVELLGAIDERRLVVHYQGIFDAATGALRGAEALVRWDHPALGLLGPHQFLPADLSGGVGWALTNFVVEEAVRQCARWADRGAPIGVSVNIAPGRLADVVLPGHIADVLARAGLAPHLLTVEITEERCQVDPDGIRRALTALARLGVRLSLDDFGTGDSTLARLRQLHFDEIKIDRLFVSSAATDPTDRDIVRFSCDLAHSLGSRVVAEGVASRAALAAARSAGVDLLQGFLLHRPGPAHTLGLPQRS